MLEHPTQIFLDKLTAQNPPPIYTLPPAKARQVLEEIQIAEPDCQDLDITDHQTFYLVKPKHSHKPLPIIFYIHGAGWIMGSFPTHKYLVTQLCHTTDAAVVFVNYSLAPEAKFPVAIEEAYQVLERIIQKAHDYKLDPNRLAIAGDSIGGNMAIALTMLAKERQGPKITCQALFYPVTSARMDTHSYTEFANGPWLTKKAMHWFWNAYESDLAKRTSTLHSPLLASLQELHGLPPALIITAENDVLRDEGEAYALRLIEAKVPVQAVRFLATIHDFMMLNALQNTQASLGAFELTTNYLLRFLCEK